MTRTQAVAAAFGLFAGWTLATYLLEARLGTFLKPDATTRFVYTVVANVLIGTIGAALVIRALVRRAELPRVTAYGIARPLRTLVLVPRRGNRDLYPFWRRHLYSTIVSHNAFAITDRGIRGSPYPTY